MADVAVLAGVSGQTVSRVSNNLSNVEPQTRLKVLAAMDALGYRPNPAARAMKEGRFRAIGVISFGLAEHGNARTLQSIAGAAQDAGYSVNVATVRSGTQEAIGAAFQHLTHQAVDGIILIESTILDTPSLRLPLGIPVVVADGDANPRFPVVDTDQTAGARSATEHLLSLGHRKIWHIAGPQNSYSARRRSAAWRATLEAAGIPAPPPLQGDWSARSGYKAGISLLARSDVTAVFVGNDQMALGLMRALHSGGRSVPDDVSVVGFDDISEAEFFEPPLTTIVQDFEHVGQECVALLLEQLRIGRTSGGTVTTLVPELVIRESTAKLVRRRIAKTKASQ
jgi:DNA-binding LacI/PurR family transcriptional regulator